MTLIKTELSHFLQKKKILNFLIFLFPLSFIFGNLIVNLEIVFISCLGIFIYKKNIFYAFDKKILFIFCLFFLILILSTIVYHNFDIQNEQIIKSIIFLRYLILFLVIGTAIKNDDLNFKLLFLSCFFISLFLSADIVFQYFFDKNLFGYSSETNHNSSIFGPELIAGGLIQKLSLLGVIFISFITQKFNKIILLMFFFVSIVAFGVLLSGNRMPFLLFILSICVSLFFFKKYRLLIIASFTIILFLLINLINNNEVYKKNLISFYNNSINIVMIFKNEIGNKSHSDKDELFKFGSGHGLIYISALDTWLDKPYLGSGIKSFRINCKKREFIFYPGKTEHGGQKNRTCAPHPHNYYLEILNDTGFIGLLVLMIGIFLISFKNINFYKSKEFKFKLINYLLILSLFIEFFPIRSSGSFFSTGNAAHIFFLLGLIVNLQKNRNYK